MGQRREAWGRMGVIVYLWSFYTSLVVITQETLFAKLGLYHWYNAVLAVAISVGIYKLVTLSPNLPTAFIVMSYGNLIARTGVSLWLSQPIGKGTWIAVILYTLGLAARHYYGR